MDKLIITRGKLFGLYAIVAILIAFEYFVAYFIQFNTKVGEFTCVPVYLENNKWGDVVLKMDCEGRDGQLSSKYREEFIEASNSKKPIRAILFSDGHLQPTKEKKE